MKLLSESSIGAGVRRVEALVGHDAYQYLAREHVLLNSLTEIIKGARADELPQRISELVEKMKSMEKELSAVRSAKALAATSQIANKSQKIRDVNLIIEQLESEIAVMILGQLQLIYEKKLSQGLWYFLQLVPVNHYLLLQFHLKQLNWELKRVS